MLEVTLTCSSSASWWATRLRQYRSSARRLRRRTLPRRPMARRRARRSARWPPAGTPSRASPTTCCGRGAPVWRPPRSQRRRRRRPPRLCFPSLGCRPGQPLQPHSRPRRLPGRRRCRSSRRRGHRQAVQRHAPTAPAGASWQPTPRRPGFTGALHLQRRLQRRPPPPPWLPQPPRQRQCRLPGLRGWTPCSTSCTACSWAMASCAAVVRRRVGARLLSCKAADRSACATSTRPTGPSQRRTSQFKATSSSMPTRRASSACMLLAVPLCSWACRWSPCRPRSTICSCTPWCTASACLL
mmetsp:Transcript_89566/g.267138  ORF Transcript_89566/g.267138 Transcript_89566/m.267138 type:complete len:298 (+) Transcript_89566:180-1073(+)